MKCAGCPHPEDCAAGRCIADVTHDDVTRYGSYHHVTVMTKTQVYAVMHALHTGMAPRTIHASNIVTPNKLKNHIALWPLWGATVTAQIAANVKAIHMKRMDWRRRQTHCIHGHEYTPENTSTQADGTRQCKTCNRASAARGKVLSAREVSTIKAKLQAGIPLGWIAGNSGPDQSHYVANFAAVNRLRREDASFDAFVKDHIKGANARGQMRRKARITTTQRRQEADDYAAISALVNPNWHAHDDIVQAIYCALLEGCIKREDLKDHINRIRLAEEALAPAKFVRRTEMRLDHPFGTTGDPLHDLLMIEDGLAYFSSSFVRR